MGNSQDSHQDGAVRLTASDVRIRDAERELLRRQREDPLRLVYDPRDRQIDIHKARKPVSLILGGNRSGKSWAMIAESQYIATGHSPWAEVPKPPSVTWYVMPSMTMFRRSIKPIFEKLSPILDIKKVYVRDGIVSYRNGSELHFLSADMRQRRLQGASIDVAFMDETPDEDVFDELLARVADRHGRLVLGFAPIDVTTYWVRDKLYLPYMAGERLDMDLIEMPVADMEGHSLVPWFTDEDIARFERQWPDPATRAARLYGQFVARSGLVFKGYDKEIHVVPPFKVPTNYARWWIVDPQYHRFAGLFFAADDKESYYITDEYFSQDENLSHRAERMAAITGEQPQKLPVYVDSANQQDIAELNWHFQRIGASLGALMLPFPKRVDDLVLRVHALLETDDERQYPKVTGLEGLYGAPRIYMFDSLHSTWTWNSREMQCSRLLWEIQRLAWSKTGKPDKDSADGADCCDCLIYGCNVRASGVREAIAPSWQRGLKDDDIRLWKLIEQHDRRSINMGFND